IPVEVHGVVMYLDRRRPNPKTGVHVLFAKELIRPHYKHPTPDPVESVRAAGGFSVISLPCLLAMKLQANRDIDRVHIRDLMSIDLIDAALVGKLPADLRKRMRDIQATE
ncbi:MAG: hypothetical protein O7F76_10295, partial [Planctomycetota bacterium]|nr:hypothetical protein [Planctomycetota bacterium]